MQNRTYPQYQITICKTEHTLNIKSLYAKQNGVQIVLCHGAFLTARKTWSSIDLIFVNSYDSGAP